jgi:two-component system OmpR family response regulator
MSKSALVIEDDEGVAQLSRRLLEMEGFRVDVAPTAADGERLARANVYSVITLDMILPDGHGLAVLEIIRERDKTTPVLIVSGIGDMASTVSALDAGADDYLLKPYKAEELRARLRALMRRGQLATSPRIRCGNVMLHLTERSVMVADSQLNLSPKEFALLEYFISHHGQTLTRAELLEKVWRFDFDPGTNMVDVNVARLRAKLVALGASCRVEARRGVGYVFSEGAPLPTQL